MRSLEQITVSEVMDTVTLADVALYGGLVAIGCIVGAGSIFWLIHKGKL